MSEKHVFETSPMPGPNSYPRRIAVIGDLGLKTNSTTAIDPSMILMVGRPELCQSVPYNWWPEGVAK